jgi:ankyrin repeat protein
MPIAMYAASMNTSKDMLMFLVELGADCSDNSRDAFNGMTCAMYAAGNGNVDNLRYLIDEQQKYLATCDYNIRDTNGMTCAMHAARTETGGVDVLKYLVEEKRVRIGDDIKDNDGNTTLDYAINEEVKETNKPTVSRDVDPLSF